MPTEAEFLADLLDGRVDVTDVPAEVAELASLAGSVRQHIALVPPTDAFRQSLREEVLQSARGAGAAGSTGASATGATTTAAATGSGGLSALVAGIAATAVLATSTLAAADRAGPDDPLAGLDRGVETLQLAIADDGRDAELLVDFAAERILEAVDLVDVAVVAGQLQRAEELLDQALALGIDQGRDLQGLTQPYVAALLTLGSRTDDPGVQEHVQSLLDEAGVSTAPTTGPGGGGSEPALGDTSDAPEEDSAATDGGSSDDGLLDDPDAPLVGPEPTDEPDDPRDGLDTPLDGLGTPLDGLDEPLEGPLDELDDAVGDAIDDLQDTTDGLLGD